ncbi:hypothetical protein QFZ32_004168 [Streptomyces canus]|nr:hypothetical protein [Streptomyces canus]
MGETSGRGGVRGPDPDPAPSGPRARRRRRPGAAAPQDPGRALHPRGGGGRPGDPAQAPCGVRKFAGPESVLAEAGQRHRRPGRRQGPAEHQGGRPPGTDRCRPGPLGPRGHPRPGHGRRPGPRRRAQGRHRRPAAEGHQRGRANLPDDGRRARQGLGGGRLRLLRPGLRRRLGAAAAAGRAAGLRAGHAEGGRVPDGHAARHGQRRPRTEAHRSRAGHRGREGPAARGLRRPLRRLRFLHRDLPRPFGVLAGGDPDRRVHLAVPAACPARDRGSLPAAGPGLQLGVHGRPYGLQQQPDVLGRRGLRPQRRLHRAVVPLLHGGRPRRGRVPEVRPVLALRQRHHELRRPGR